MCGAARRRSRPRSFRARRGGARLDETNVYACADVVVDDVSESGVDYAFLRLDRPVETGATPAIPRVEPPELAEALTLVSFPGGIPMKGTRAAW